MHSINNIIVKYRHKYSAIWNFLLGSQAHW